MRVTERYRRVDHDTILYDITVTDPKAYTQPIVGPHRIMKLRPKDEMVEEICVPVGREILCQPNRRAGRAETLEVEGRSCEILRLLTISRPKATGSFLLCALRVLCGEFMFLPFGK